jgi:two-component system chemotaxis response regulator CheB
MPRDFVQPFAARLAGNTRLSVNAAEEGQVPESGNVYVSEGEPHLLIDQGRLRFSQPQPGVYNTMDLLFGSMARELGSGAIAVILTRMGPDGAAGMKEVRDAGGRTIAQDEATSLVPSKPLFAIRSGAAGDVLPLQAIAPRLLDLVATGDM